MDEELGARVDVARGLVEDEHLRTGDHHAGDAQQLLLAGGQTRGAVKHGVVAAGHAADELVGVSCLGGGDDLVVGGVGTADGDVLAHRRAPHPGILQYHAPAAAQARAREVAHVVAVHRHAAGVDVVEAHEQVDEGGLSAAGVADERNAAPGLGGKVEVLQDRAAGRVREGHVVERDFALDAAELEGSLGVRLLERLVDELKEVARAGDGVLQLRDHAGDVVERLGVLVGVLEEGGEAAHGDAAAEHDERAEDTDGGVDERVHEAHGRVGERREEHRLVALLREAGVDVAHAAADLVGDAERLDGAHAADHLLDEARELAAQLGLAREMLARVTRDELGHPDRERREHGNHAGDQRVQAEHEHERDNDGQDAGRELLETHDEAVGELVGVVDDATRDLAVLVGVDVGQRHALEVVEGLAAQVECRVVGEAVGHERERVLGGGGHADGERHEAGDVGQGHEVDGTRAHHAVDGPACERGQGEGAHGDHDDEGYEGAKHGAPARKEPEHTADGLVVLVLLSSRGRRGGGVLCAHRWASSLVSWESQISRYTSQLFSSSSCVPRPT